LLHFRVVAVTAINAYRRVELVNTSKLYAGDLLDDIHQFVYADQLAAAQVDGFMNVALKNHSRAFQTIIDVHKAAALRTVSPDFDVASA
jgi:hypothetical protein